MGCYVVYHGFISRAPSVLPLFYGLAIVLRSAILRRVG